MAVDAGVIDLRDRPYVLVAMATYLSSDAKGSAAIEAASRAAFEYFSTLADSSQYGRRLR